MKKRILALTLAIVIMSAMCLSLVACDDPTAISFKFSEDMTVDEIIDALGKLNSFTYEAYPYNGIDFDDTDISVSYYNFKNNMFDCDAFDWDNGDKVREYRFYKNGVMYTYMTGSERYAKKQCTDEQWANWLKAYRMAFTDDSLFVFYLRAGDYTIENGNLKVHNVSGIWLYTIKDMNKTKVKIPKEFSDYKSREFTE